MLRAPPGPDLHLTYPWHCPEGVLLFPRWRLRGVCEAANGLALGWWWCLMSMQPDSTVCALPSPGELPAA